MSSFCWLLRHSGLRTPVSQKSTTLQTHLIAILTFYNCCWNVWEMEKMELSLYEFMKLIWKCLLNICWRCKQTIIPAANQTDESPTYDKEVTLMSLSFNLCVLSESWRAVPSLASCLHLLPGQQRPSRTLWTSSKSWQMFIITAIVVQCHLGSMYLVELSQSWCNYTSGEYLDTFFWADFKWNVKKISFVQHRSSKVLCLINLVRFGVH